MRIERQRFTAGSETDASVGVDLLRVDPVVFQFGVQRGAADLKVGGGLFDVTVDLFDGRNQDFALRCLEAAGEIRHRWGIGRKSGPNPGRQVGDINYVGPREDNRLEDDVLEFADIAGPMIGTQEPQGGSGDGVNCLAVFAGESADEMPS